MLLQELKEKAFMLSPSDRLALASAIIESLQEDISTPRSTAEIFQKRTRAVQQMRGLLKTNRPAPTDREVAAMLEQRREEKYL